MSKNRKKRSKKRAKKRAIQRGYSTKSEFIPIKRLLKGRALRKTLKKAEIQGERIDQREQERLHKRSLKKQYQRRERMLRRIAEREQKYREKQKKDKVFNNLHHISDEKYRICSSRSRKRQALFATLKAGKGIAGPKNRKYTEKSKVRC